MKNYKVIIEEARPAIPTLLAFGGTHDLGEVEDQDVLQIPVIGTIGKGGAERAFCKPAHDFASGVLVPDKCPLESNLMCGLTGCREYCLFTQFDHPIWSIIKESVALERA